MNHWDVQTMPTSIFEPMPKGIFDHTDKTMRFGSMPNFFQHIQPVRILVLNIMPAKIETEIRLLRLMENNFYPITVEFIHPQSHDSKNTTTEYLKNFYKTFDQVKGQKFDGMIITGAPVETIDFEAVDYWDEMKAILEWTKTNVRSTLHICWGAMAGLYYHYGIAKKLLPEKLSGVFTNQIRRESAQPLLKDFRTDFYMPHSRFSEVLTSEIECHPELEILATSREAGMAVAASKDGRQIFIQGHFEYDSIALANEYKRDSALGKCFKVPENYFPWNDPEAKPKLYWYSHSKLLTTNWLRYYVGQPVSETTSPKQEWFNAPFGAVPEMVRRFNSSAAQ